MPRSRKTVEVKALIEWANSQLYRTDEEATKEWKAGICDMLKQALHLSGSYNGFYHLDPEDCDINTLGYWSRKYF